MKPNVKLNIVGKQIEITEGIKKHAEKAVEKIEHFKGPVDELDMVLEKEHVQYTASVTFDLFKKKHHIESKGHDLYESIDTLMDKVERTIRKSKERVTDHSGRKSISEVALESENLESESESESENLESESESKENDNE